MTDSKSTKSNRIPLLPSGSMPTLALGTMCSTGDSGAQIAAAIRAAVPIGYRHFDCAPVYGNEADVGAALAECMDQKLVERKDLFITSKLWTKNWSDVKSAVEATLKSLKLQYLDLYLIHLPFENLPLTADQRDGKAPVPKHVGYNAERVLVAWQQMEACVDAGLIRAIGVSNFTTTKLKALVGHTRLPIAVNQIQIHPYVTQPDHVTYCKQNNIAVMAYYAIGSARRPASLRTNADPVMLDDPVVAGVGKDDKTTPSSVLIAWSLAKGFVPVVKSITPARLKENFDAAAAVVLTAAQVATVDALNRNFRYGGEMKLFLYPSSMTWQDMNDHEYTTPILPVATVAKK